MVYVPESFEPKSAKILVVIHGCLQSPESMALGTQFNRIADKENIVVLYPKVPTKTHPVDCWSWFLSESQRPGSGQLQFLMNHIEGIRSRYQLKTNPAFVVGISSGAAIAANLLACYPSYFQGGGLHSGPPYGLVADEEHAAKLLKAGPTSESKRLGPCDPSTFKGKLIVVHGSKDPVVNLSNAHRLMSDFFPHSRAQSHTSSDNGRTFTVTAYSREGKSRGRLVIIAGMGHAWSGFGLNMPYGKLIGPQAKTPTQLPFFDPKGPDSSEMIWQFLSGGR